MGLLSVASTETGKGKKKKEKNSQNVFHSLFLTFTQLTHLESFLIIANNITFIQCLYTCRNHNWQCMHTHKKVVMHFMLGLCGKLQPMGR